MAYGQYDKAEQYIRAAVETVRDLQDADSEKAICLIDLATLYSYQDRLAESEAMFLRGLEAQKNALGQDHPYVSHTLRNLSAVYRKQGQLDKAALALEEAFSIILIHHLPDNRILTPFYMDQASLLCQQGHFDEAEFIFTEMLGRVETEFGREHLYYSEVQKGLATVYLNTGRYEQASQLLDRSLQIQEKIYGQNHQLLIGSYLLAARVCRGQHDEQGMQQYFDKAVAAVSRTGNLIAAANLYMQIEQIRRTEVLIASAAQTLSEDTAG
jgi:tetratricopeptide (TPR) repeat protein